MADRLLRVLTWHVHGNYLWYLSSVPVEWYVPAAPGDVPGLGGRGHTFPFPGNVIEVPAERLGELEPDVVLHQSHLDLLDYRRTLLTEAQRAVPALHLEHDPPRQHPTDAVHPAAATGVGLVHVTRYNALMWDAAGAPTTVVEHGVAVPPSTPTLELERGIVVVNDLATRGRRLGADLVARLREVVPLDVVGMRSEAVGGLGEVPPPELAAMLGQYRFFLHPARYTSLGLAVLEAMHCGVPVVGLPTTELAAVVTDGVDGFLGADETTLVDRMVRLLGDQGLARTVGAAGAAMARERFGIERFRSDWLAVLHAAAARRPLPQPAATPAASRSTRVVERPATSGTNASRPPHSASTDASGTSRPT